MKKHIKIVFQGDSITDGSRDRRNYHDMGKSYPKYASELIASDNTEFEFEFINQGIGGNRSSQLFDRLYADAIAFKPDIISVLIGINDIWHRYSSENVTTSNEQFALNYKSILQRLKRETNAKIVMLQPYLLDGMKNDDFRADKERIKVIVNKLAEEYADAYIPLDDLFAEAMKTQPSENFYSADGVHPNPNGAEFIAGHYASAIKEILKDM